MQFPQNHLANASSLYLRQHAKNPVNWYPWGEEAISLARKDNKPILLSIGYSACHWCHVMAHECFENPDIAQLMNAHFINIKVDREERPDLDKIYQTSYMLLMGRGGGWPLTIFLSPEDLTPFFAGTYFPPKEQRGLPAFSDVLNGIINFYRARQSEIQQQNIQLRELLSEALHPPAPTTAINFDENIFTKTRDLLIENFDTRYGGFGDAPKFPQPTYLFYLFNYFLSQQHTQQPDLDTEHVVKFSLQKMSEGGIYDHVGGGFFRYCVDAAWQIPHFEKMLYDNAQLLTLLTITGQVFSAKNTAEWVLTEMEAAHGGYFATLDADSEGKEGHYYYWDRETIASLLTDSEYQLIQSIFELNQPPNFEGHWHLIMRHAVSPDHFTQYQEAMHKLFLARKKRVYPGRDEKIIISWNSLMIKAMALAGRILNEPRYIHSAQRAVDYIFQTFWQSDKQRLKNAFLDDYAFLLDGLLELLQTEWRNTDISFATNLANALLDQFTDIHAGGFYFSSNDHEVVLQRPKSLMDEALPSGNGIAAYALARLGFLIGNQHYLTASENTLKVAWPSMLKLPHLHTSLLLALRDYLNPPELIILRGNNNELIKWQKICQTSYHPQRLVFAIPSDIKDLPENLAIKTAKQNISAFVCQGSQCTEVINDIDKLINMLK